jgi:hypothetical protein
MIPSITFGVEIFHYFAHKYWVQQFHGIGKTWFLVGFQIGSPNVSTCIVTPINPFHYMVSVLL